MSATMRSRVRTPQPTAPSGTVGVRESLIQAVGAMSMWAQGTPLVKRWRNRAAVMDPPARPLPVFFTSAIGLSMWRS